MDLSKVTFPTFVLEPRSMLERITDFMAHPDIIFGWVVPLLYSALAASRHPRAPLTQHMLLLGSAAAPELTLCVKPRFFTVPAPVSPERSLIFTFSSYCIRSAELCEEPEERFIRVLQYYLAGWHIKPKGVKKP
jgi:hypothetical protein